MIFILDLYHCCVYVIIDLKLFFHIFAFLLYKGHPLRRFGYHSPGCHCILTLKATFLISAWQMFGCYVIWQMFGCYVIWQMLGCYVIWQMFGCYVIWQMFRFYFVLGGIGVVCNWNRNMNLHHNFNCRPIVGHIVIETYCRIFGCFCFLTALGNLP